MKPNALRGMLPHLGFVLVYLLWGINISSMKIGGAAWDSFVFNGLRYLIILPFLWVYTYYGFRKGRIRLSMKKGDLGRILLLGAVSAVGMEAFLSYALQYSNAANGAVLGRGFMPVVTVILALLMRELRLTWRILLGLPLAIAGVIVIVTGGNEGFHLGPDTLRGDVLLLFRSFLGALYLIGMNRLVNRYPLTLLITLEMTAGAVSLLPVVLWKVTPGYLAAMPAAGWYSLLYTAFLATLVGFSVHNWSLGKLGPFKSSVYGYFLPVTSAIAGIYLLGESISWNQVLGGAGVLVAMYLVQRDRMQAMKRPPKPIMPAAAGKSNQA
ncbi:DMT family transporter [Paenibacillus aurantius]|uniref:DMT family transporter n=1 Tax=Paenibacillus aurantius TaxID=2918900 RepID=A0AA96RG29_9BACL|nr:DMT family transporter [Paenibacillus aurantius]WNQ12627.1 DMT family transporter [Paenibacillus aurantius]